MLQVGIGPHCSQQPATAAMTTSAQLCGIAVLGTATMAIAGLRNSLHPRRRPVARGVSRTLTRHRVRVGSPGS